MVARKEGVEKEQNTRNSKAHAKASSASAGAEKEQVDDRSGTADAYAEREKCGISRSRPSSIKKRTKRRKAKKKSETNLILILKSLLLVQRHAPSLAVGDLETLLYTGGKIRQYHNGIARERINNIWIPDPRPTPRAKSKAHARVDQALDPSAIRDWQSGPRNGATPDQSLPHAAGAPPTEPPPQDPERPARADPNPCAVPQRNARSGAHRHRRPHSHSGVCARPIPSAARARRIASHPGGRTDARVDDTYIAREGSACGGGGKNGVDGGSEQHGWGDAYRSGGMRYDEESQERNPKMQKKARTVLYNIFRISFNVFSCARKRRLGTGGPATARYILISVTVTVPRVCNPCIPSLCFASHLLALVLARPVRRSLDQSDFKEISAKNLQIRSNTLQCGFLCDTALELDLTEDFQQPAAAKRNPSLPGVANRCNCLDTVHLYTMPQL
ncbi:hypothetical protein B0H13DRAFT_1909011 [Mycena leptocephala]|nr:hypothetical protein B0H13DRAFT_1909011 [Mycena leptocephala]